MGLRERTKRRISTQCALERLVSDEKVRDPAGGVPVAFRE